MTLKVQKSEGRRVRVSHGLQTTVEFENLEIKVKDIRLIL